MLTLTLALTLPVTLTPTLTLTLTLTLTKTSSNPNPNPEPPQDPHGTRAVQCLIHTLAMHPHYVADVQAFTSPSPPKPQP